jgi:hypothetical protein
MTIDRFMAPHGVAAAVVDTRDQSMWLLGLRCWTWRWWRTGEAVTPWGGLTVLKQVGRVDRFPHAEVLAVGAMAAQPGVLVADP